MIALICIMTDVSVFGTFHWDRPGKVEAELSEFSKDVDVFFVESPKEESDNSDEQRLLLRNPIISITGLILDFVWGLFGFIITQSWRPVDAYVTDKVADKQDIDISQVDMNLIRRASNVNILITAISWFLLLVMVALLAVGMLTLTLFPIGLAVVVGFVPLVPFAYWTLPERDEIMAKNIQEFIETHEGVDNVCLVVGQKHMKGVIDQLKDENIDVNKAHKSKFLRYNS